MEVSYPKYVHNKLAAYDIWSFVLSLRLSDLLHNYCGLFTFKNFRSGIRYICGNDRPGENIENSPKKKRGSLGQQGYQWYYSSLDSTLSCYYNSKL